MEPIQLAREFAINAHKGQKYGTFAYEKHLADVYLLTREFDLPADVRAAAWLHDVLEDTDANYYQLATRFGLDVLSLVDAVTDQPGRNRQERHEKTYPRIKRNPMAVALKLCDRIANVEFAVSTQNIGKVKMYAKEHGAFKDALYSSDLAPLWHRLQTIQIPFGWM